MNTLFATEIHELFRWVRFGKRTHREGYLGSTDDVLDAFWVRLSGVEALPRRLVWVFRPPSLRYGAAFFAFGEKWRRGRDSNSRMQSRCGIRYFLNEFNTNECH